MTKHVIIKHISILKNNYVWVIIDRTQHSALIVDPGEAKPVITFLKEHHLSPLAVLITHHHWDHTHGIGVILNHYNIPVYGPAHEKIRHVSHLMTAVDTIKIIGFPLEMKVLDIPGHTTGHVAYYSPGILFCGDTLFAAGCGKIFEGTAAQMYESLQKIAALPDDTLIYCSHEYTLNNLRFAQKVEPGNTKILERMERVTELKHKNHPSIPSTLKEEKATNPFLRCDSPEIQAVIKRHNKERIRTPIDVFRVLRKWKDHF